MSAARSSRARPWVAILAAYVLVLQGLLGGAVAGQGVATALLDRATHLTLCAPGGEATPLPGEQPSPHLPDCCVAGCLAMAAAYGAAPARSAPLRPPVPVATPVSFAEPAGKPLPGEERLASRPRGPPLEA